MFGDRADMDVQYYMILLHEATTSAATVSLVGSSLRGYGAPSSPFGNVVILWPANKGSLTMAQAAAIEWHAVEDLLRRVCPVKGAITKEE